MCEVESVLPRIMVDSDIFYQCVNVSVVKAVHSYIFYQCLIIFEIDKELFYQCVA
jgi:hypothetical protein